MEKKTEERLQEKESIKSFYYTNEWLREQKRYFDDYEKHLRRISDQFLKSVVGVYGD